MQITFGRHSRSDMISLIGHTNMQRITIRIAIHSHTAQSQFPAGANDTHSNLTSIDHKHFLKWPVCYRGHTHNQAPSTPRVYSCLLTCSLSQIFLLLKYSTSHRLPTRTIGP